MTSPDPGLVKRVREARAAVSEALARAHLARAWDLLHERDAEGNLRGIHPYTTEALAELAAAHDHDPEDVGVLHHLAIAHHARAWDLELAGDPRAAREWETALGYWRGVAASALFWAGLEEKLLACDPTAAVTCLAEVRRDLLEKLLDIHVDFVHHYCEGDAPERATGHVEIIRRARIPPAVKKRLLGKVFAAMTSSVPEAKARGAHASALTTLERFLALFPDHLPALRMHAELCKEWVLGLSYQTDWEAILEVGRRAESPAHRLAAHPGLGEDPLARAAVADLALELVQRGHDRTRKYFADRDYRDLGANERQAMAEAFAFGLSWGRLGQTHSPSGSEVWSVYGGCLQDHAVALHQEGREVMRSAGRRGTMLAAALGLYRKALAETEEALLCRPGDESLTSNLQLFREAVADLERDKGMLDLVGDWRDRK